MTQTVQINMRKHYTVEDEELRGTYGPNDGGYIHEQLVKACIALKRAQELYSQGHYPHSDAKNIPENHALRAAMEQLTLLDQEYAEYANKQPDEHLFNTYEPPYEDTVRWSSRCQLEEPKTR